MAKFNLITKSPELPVGELDQSEATKYTRFVTSQPQLTGNLRTLRSGFKSQARKMVILVLLAKKQALIYRQ